MAAVSNNSVSAVSSGWTASTIVCVSLNKNLNFRGIWYGDSPFDFVYPTVLAKITIVSLLSRFLFCLLRPLEQPKFVCYVLGGIILGPSVLGRNKLIKKIMFPPRENELMLTMAIIGGIYSVFLVGVKMDKFLIKRSARNAWRIGIFGFLSSLTVGSCLIFPQLSNFSGLLLEGGPFVLYVPLSLSYTFFPVLTQALEELNLLNSEIGQLALSSAVLNDLIFWFFLALSIVFKQEKLSQSFQVLCAFAALVIFTFTVVRRSVWSVIRNIPVGKPIKEIHMTTVLLGVLVMAFVSSSIGVTPIIGSLFLGLVIPGGPPFGSAIVQKTESIVSEFLMPIFFIQVGFSTDVNSIHNWPIFIKFQIIIALAYFAKFVGTFLASLTCKIGFRNALMLGLIMNIKGILELIHYHRWKSNQYIDEQTYTQFVLSVLGVTMIVTPLIKLLCKPAMWLDPSFKHRGLRTLQSIPSNSEFRILCIIHNEESVHGIIALLEASNPMDSSSICAYIVQTSELNGLALPLLVPYYKQRKLKLASSAKTNQIIRAFENYSNNSRGPVTIMPFIMVASYKTMHESVCRLAQDKFIPLIIVPFHRYQRYSIGSSIGTALRQFNINVQSYAPCTVGILVDRGFTCGMSKSHFSYHVAVIFIGGPDDREALAYATRMSNQQAEVTVTVMRIVLREKKECTNEEQEIEVSLNESVAEDFKLKNVGNALAVWHEIEVEEEDEVISAIRSVEGHYDLVMVGRRRSWDVSMGEQEMSDFVENVELGVIGDTLASSDFCGGMVSVLVMQHYIGEVYRSTYRSNSLKSNNGEFIL